MRQSPSYVLLALGLLLCLPVRISAGGQPGPQRIRQQDVPVVISESGSYRLVSNLTVTDPNVTAIFVSVDNVTIDLAGFTIFGPEIGPVGAGSGIDIAVQNHVVVRNGAVRGFFDVAAACIHLPGNSNRVEDVRVESCPQQAIFVGPSSAVIDCQIANSGSGINTDDGSLVLNNSLFQIAGHCISTDGGAPSGPGGVAVIGNNCRNSGFGINVVGPGHRIENNVITGTDTAIDLTFSTDSYFARNLLQGNVVALLGEADDTDGGSIDPALSNIVLP